MSFDYGCLTSTEDPNLNYSPPGVDRMTDSSLDSVPGSHPKVRGLDPHLHPRSDRTVDLFFLDTLQLSVTRSYLRLVSQGYLLLRFPYSVTPSSLLDSALTLTPPSTQTGPYGLPTVARRSRDDSSLYSLVSDDSGWEDGVGPTSR